MKYFQALDEVIDAMTATQKIFFSQVRLIVKENAAIQLMNWSGAIAGSEFLTYDATKLYIALQLDIGYYGNPGLGNYFIALYDELNAVTFGAHNSSAYYESVTPNQYRMGEILQLQNYYFSRVVAGSYTYMKFIGFKVAYAI